ncbi:MAG: response regulator transcription factor [Betaproteobacteria bacterium]|nr:response regulator transcription factor [Betaproteobacteria bacterium]
MHADYTAHSRAWRPHVSLGAGDPEESRRTLLVADDDPAFCRVLKRAMESRGFAVRVAHDVEQAAWMAQDDPPEFALVDLNMPGVSGLALVQRLKQIDDKTCVVVLTGYASIATAIEAIKLGATHYLTKPLRTEEILAAFNRVEPKVNVPINEDPMRISQLEWEHIQKTLLEHKGNVSATAKALGMHRRTLQRRLSKRPATT